MVSPKKRANNDAYNAKCDRFELRPLKTIGTDIRAAASSEGQSVQAYVLQAVSERMARDNFTPAADWAAYKRPDER